MAFTPAIFVDRRRCIGCDACSVACRQENNFENSPAVVAGARTMAANQRWNQVYQYEEGAYPRPRTQLLAITFEQCTMCAHRLAAGLLPACVITCMGITREFGDYETLKSKYDGHKMEDGAKETILYGNLGSEPSLERSPLPPTGYMPPNDCRQCHNGGGD